VLLRLSKASELADTSEEVVSLANALFVVENLDSLHAILSTRTTEWISCAQVNIATKLIGQLCSDESHQMAVADSGILDALASILAGFAVAKGEMVPGAEIVAQNEGLEDEIPRPTPAIVALSGVLEAIAAVIGDSRLRSCMLLNSPPILAVFPTVSFDIAGAESRVAGRAFESSSVASMPGPTAVELLLPVVPTHQARSPYSTAPQFARESRAANLRASTRLSANLSGWDSSRFESPATASSGETETEEPESPLVPWLISLFRSTTDNDRLMAASVLTSLYKAGFAGTARESTIAMVIVPPLIQLLKDIQNWTESEWVDAELSARWASAECALSVLARLLTDSEYLQKAAYDCKAMKVFCHYLKDAYEKKPSAKLRRWEAHPVDAESTARRGHPSTSSMGPQGHEPEHFYRIRLRESSLKAIASLIAFKDEFRKAFVEQDAVSLVVDSLQHSPSSAKGPKAEEMGSASPGRDEGAGRNSPTVLIAACYAIRMLSRSPSVLRTTLEDAGAGMPLFALLKHPDIDVQIAATGAVCNFLMDVSPMREVSRHSCLKGNKRL
jgi:armadillo repeat-containing protein 8